MSVATQILERAKSLGVLLQPEGASGLYVRGPKVAIRELAPILKQHKPEILRELIGPAQSARQALEAEGYAARCLVFEPKAAQPALPDPAEQSGHWLISLPPERLERWFSPAVTRAELEQRYPGAVLVALPEETQASAEEEPRHA